MRFSIAVALASYFLTAWSQNTTCPSGPQPPDTNSGGFDFTYPWPINYKTLQTQHQTLCQAYMDVKPEASKCNGQTIVLFHGKNFCGATWNATAHVLLSKGYRVIIPDQIGFCKSSKPDAYQFSLQQYALNTRQILDGLNITSPIIMGHSMGGMLASRFTLMYGDYVSRLIMVDPLGLEDWKAKGEPYNPIDNIYKTEHASNYTSIRTYEQATYYVNTWDPAYDVWVNMLLKLYDGPLGEKFAFDMALVTDMIITQPVIYEFHLLKNTKTLLIVGDKDNTAIGKAWAPPAVQAILGNYSVLGREAAAKIGENCTYVHYPDLGHAPHIQAPERFYKSVLDFLGQDYP